MTDLDAIRTAKEKQESHCDYCEEGIPVVDGWHEITDPEGIEGTSRIPCPKVSQNE